MSKNDKNDGAKGKDPEVAEDPKPKDETVAGKMAEATGKTGAPPFAGHGVGSGLSAVTGDDFEGEKVKMSFPKRVRILIDGHRAIEWPAGVHNVPEAFVDHWYLKANGVEKA